METLKSSTPHDVSVGPRVIRAHSLGAVALVHHLPPKNCEQRALRERVERQVEASWRPGYYAPALSCDGDPLASGDGLPSPDLRRPDRRSAQKGPPLTPPGERRSASYSASHAEIRS